MAVRCGEGGDTDMGQRTGSCRRSHERWYVCATMGGGDVKQGAQARGDWEAEYINNFDRNAILIAVKAERIHLSPFTKDLVNL